jgi:hypothetical protein
VLATRASQAGAQNVDLREVLDMPDPSAPERTVAETVLMATLRGSSAMLQQDLTTCAAAVDIETASRRQALGLAAGGGGGALDQFCTTDLWVETAGEPARRVLLPFLRRVLLHVLASRPNDAPDNWNAVHERLRDYYLDERHDERAALYHALAFGDIAAVVAYLDPRLHRLETREWLADLMAIARAPRGARSLATPRDQVNEIAHDGGTLAHLIAALWISSDPLGDPHATLSVLVAADLERLAPRSREPTLLLDEANTYRVRGQTWRNHEQHWKG